MNNNVIIQTHDGLKEDCEVKVLLGEESGRTTVLVCVRHSDLLPCRSSSAAADSTGSHLLSSRSSAPARSLVAQVADEEFGYVQLTYDLQSFGAQLSPERQPAELLQTHGRGYGRSTHCSEE